MTINLTRYFGLNFRRMPDANDRPYLVVFGWYPRARKELGYFRVSLPLSA